MQKSTFTLLLVVITYSLAIIHILDQRGFRTSETNVDNQVFTVLLAVYQWTKRTTRIYPWVIKRLTGTSDSQDADLAEDISDCERWQMTDEHNNSWDVYDSDLGGNDTEESTKKSGSVKRKRKGKSGLGVAETEEEEPVETPTAKRPRADSSNSKYTTPPQVSTQSWSLPASTTTTSIPPAIASGAPQFQLHKGNDGKTYIFNTVTSAAKLFEAQVTASQNDSSSASSSFVGAGGPSSSAVKILNSRDKGKGPASATNDAEIDEHSDSCEIERMIVQNISNAYVSQKWQFNTAYCLEQQIQHHRHLLTQLKKTRDVLGEYIKSLETLVDKSSEAVYDLKKVQPLATQVHHALQISKSLSNEAPDIARNISNKARRFCEKAIDRTGQGSDILLLQELFVPWCHDRLFVCNQLTRTFSEVPRFFLALLRYVSSKIVQSNLANMPDGVK